VFGVEDPRVGRAVAAVVVLQVEHTVTTKELIAALSHATRGLQVPK